MVFRLNPFNDNFTMFSYWFARARFSGVHCSRVGLNRSWHISNWEKTISFSELARLFVNSIAQLSAKLSALLICRASHILPLSFTVFLVADTQLYKRLCPSVCPSVRPSARPLVRHARVENAKNTHFRCCSWYCVE